MSNYSNLERKIARVLGSNPKLKAILKDIYTRVMRITAFKNERHVGSHQLKSFGLSGESFFGYYDKNPSNGNGLIIFHTSEFDTSKSIKAANYIEVNLMNEETNQIIWSGKTKAFNWQQGSRLQWATNEKFIFNDFNETKNIYISKLVSIKDFEVCEFDMPVQDIFSDNYFLSLNYDYLASLNSDYGYYCKPQRHEYELVNFSDDGIWKIEVYSKEKTLLFSFTDILNLKNKPEFIESKHEINHIQISPSGNKFVFLHRYFINGQRNDRLILASANLKEMKLLFDSSLISHYCWLDNNCLAIYLNDNQYGESYYHYDIEKQKWTKIFGLDSFGDGHPSGAGTKMITDTYPDRSGMQSLFLVNDIHKKESIELIGKFYHPLKFKGPTRCDLHPRFDSKRKIVYFDSVFSGKRQLYRMEIL